MIESKDIMGRRKEFGVSQVELAEVLGVSRPTLIKIERGERELKDVEAQKLRDVFAHFEVGGMDMRISVPQGDIDKFRQVLLYVLEKTAGKPNVGMTVLYKLLYFIDFDYYEKYEEQLMGLTYFKNTHGPAPREFARVVDDMKKGGDLEEVKSKFFTYDLKKFLPHKSADLSVLTGRELEMIDDVLARYADKTATEISDISHRDMPWAAAEEGKDLEYDHVFYRGDQLSVREYEQL